MSKKMFPSDVLAQAATVQDAWVRIDNTMKVGDLSAAMLLTDINQIRQVEQILIGMENQLAEVRNQRDALCQSAWDKVKRVRAAVKGNYGDDSSQYELVGGTRLSDRKPVRRTAIPVQ